MCPEQGTGGWQEALAFSLLQGTKSARSSLGATPLGTAGSPADKPRYAPLGTRSLPGCTGRGRRSHMKSPAFYSYKDSKNTRRLLTPGGRTQQAWPPPVR